MPAHSGFRVLSLFHPTAMVADLQEAAVFYRTVFGVTSLTIPYTAASRAYRSLTIVGDVCIENISPEQAHLSQFRMYTDLVGNHWFFPCFYVEDMQDALYHLHHRHRIRLTESGTGNPVIGIPPGGSGRSLLFTHPADTGIMWEFYEADQEWFVNSPLADPRKRPGWKLAPPGSDDPLAAGVLSHLTVVVQDPSAARRFLVDVCGGRVFAEDEDVELGTRSTWVTLGAETTVVELAVPVKAGPRKRDLEKVGNTAHSLTFIVRDLERASAYLRSKGLAFEIESDHLIVTDPTTSIGLRFGFIERFHRGDPRTSGAGVAPPARPRTMGRQRAKGRNQ
jgi:catechol 2,3-dioxygenase-like lactoylglutathione lyase family enzyme